MDQFRDLAWWAEVVFGGWVGRPGPRYQRLAACLLDAVSRRVLVPGARVPAERQLAMVVGVSRGTVVACFEHLVATGVLRRQVGAGTFVVGPPSWATSVRGAGVAELLLRRLAGDVPVIDLSVSCPGDVRHLPSVPVALESLEGNGLDPHGLPSLRSAVASHLTTFGRLPTSADQIVVCAGAQEALWLLGRVLRPPQVLASCPLYPGLIPAFGSRLDVVPGDVAGTTAVEVSRAPGGSVACVMPDGHNPTGLVMSGIRRQAFASVADAERVVVVEDMALADLWLDPSRSLFLPPLAALSPAVIAVGSVSKLLWGGLRVGWIRASDPGLLDALVARKAALNLATSAVAQAYAAGLLLAVSSSWLSSHRAALVARRDHLVSLIGALLPAWSIDVVPAAGLSLWVRLPVADASAFAHVASRHGVMVAPGALACVCGSHRGYVRLSFAEQLDTLSLAVERLAVAWEAHSENLAAGLVS